MELLEHGFGSLVVGKPNTGPLVACCGRGTAARGLSPVLGCALVAMWAPLAVRSRQHTHVTRRCCG